MRPTRTAVAVVSLVLAFAARGAAQDLLVHEGLAYGVPTAGTPMHGVDGGAGWRGPWQGNTQTIVDLGTYWSLDGSGTGIGRALVNGTMMSGASYSNNVPPSTTSTRSLQLDAQQSQYLDLSSGISSYASCMRGTISLWFRTDNESRQVMLSASNSQATQRFVAVGIQSGTVFYEVKGDLYANLKTSQSGPGFADGQWHHLAVVVAGDGGVILYLDGNPSGTTFDEGFFGNVFGLDAMAMGRLLTSTGDREYFDGEIDEVAIWGSPLDANDVRALASGATPSFAMGPSLPTGPTLAGSSLGSNAFGAGGLRASGDHYADASGDRAWRSLAEGVSQRVAATRYVSFLVRRDDRGAPIRKGRVLFADNRLTSCVMGWRDDGKWIGGMNNVSPAIATVPMQDRTTYFVVVELQARGLLPTAQHRFAMKVYGPNDTVHASTAELVGAGPQRNQWTILQSAPGASAGDTAWILHSGSGPGLMEVDELRVGKTWESVTRIGFGASCAGATLDRNGRLALGATFSLDVSGLARNSIATLMVGRGRSQWLGGALPMSLEVYGAPGCWLHVSPEAVVAATTDGLGSASRSFFVRNDPLWLGIPVYAQWGGMDAAVPSTNPFPFVFTSATELVFER